MREDSFSHGWPIISIDKRIELLIRVENYDSYDVIAFSAVTKSKLLIKSHKICRQEGIESSKCLTGFRFENLYKQN